MAMAMSIIVQLQMIIHADIRIGNRAISICWKMLI